jgi:hypothetical protein
MYNNNKSGLYIGSETGISGPHDCLVVDCIAHNNGSHAYADHGIYCRFGVTIRGCTSYSNYYGGFKTNCQANQGRPYHPIVENSTSYSNVMGGVCDNQYSIWRNNQIYSNTLGGVTIGNHDVEFYFNTFVNNGTDYIGEIRFEIASTGGTYKNNILVNTGVYSKCLMAYSPITLNNAQANNTFDYNTYYKDGNAATPIAMTYNTASYTFAQWQALSNSPDAHSTLLTAVPGFVTRYTDLHPADGGNLDAHSGLAIAGYELDKDGNTRADPPNCGCYEEASA